MNIRVVESDRDFLLLKNDWDLLAQNYSVVNSFYWLFKWWRHFGTGNDLRILVAEENNKVVGIAPLFIENTKALKSLPFKHLCFLGGEVSDYLDFLIVQDHKREMVFKSFIDFIVNKLDYDLIDFRQINSFYPNFDLWQKYTDSFNFKFSAYKSCPGICTVNFSSYDEYIKSLGSKFKYSLDSHLDRLKKDNIKVEFAFENDISEEDINIVADMNIRRQRYLYNKGDKKEFCYFYDSNNKSFINDFFCSKSDKKMLTSMKFNDEIASYILLLMDKDTIYCWNTVYDNKYEKYAPVKLLINEIARFAFDNNFKYLDFMRGKSSFELEWSNIRSFNYNLKKEKSFIAKMITLYRDNVSQFLSSRLRTSNLTNFLDDENIV